MLVNVQIKYVGVIDDVISTRNIWEEANMITQIDWNKGVLTRYKDLETLPGTTLPDASVCENNNCENNKLGLMARGLERRVLLVPFNNNFIEKENDREQRYITCKQYFYQ